MRFAETVDQLLAAGPVTEATNTTGGPDEGAAADVPEILDPGSQPGIN